jgi:hypothetical protein
MNINAAQVFTRNICNNPLKRIDRWQKGRLSEGNGGVSSWSISEDNLEQVHLLNYFLSNSWFMHNFS